MLMHVFLILAPGACSQWNVLYRMFSRTSLLLQVTVAFAGASPAHSLQPYGQFVRYCYRMLSDL